MRRLSATLTAPDGGVVSGVAFSPDGRTLAFVDNGDHAYLCPMSDQFGRHRSGSSVADVPEEEMLAGFGG